MFRTVAPNSTLIELKVWFDEAVETDEVGPLELPAAIRLLLTRNRTLQELSLFRLAVDTAALVLENVFAALSTENRSLSHLRLDLKETSESLRALLPATYDMLQHNPVLSTLVGFPFPKDDPVSIQVQFMLKQNRYGRRLLLERPEQDEDDGGDDHVSTGVWPKVLAKISEDGEHGVMFQFLRAKPGIVRPFGGIVARSRGRGRRRLAASGPDSGGGRQASRRTRARVTG
jgi:hypothetical protein